MNKFPPLTLNLAYLRGGGWIDASRVGFKVGLSSAWKWNKISHMEDENYDTNLKNIWKIVLVKYFWFMWWQGWCWWWKWCSIKAGFEIVIAQGLRWIQMTHILNELQSLQSKITYLTKRNNLIFEIIQSSDIMQYINYIWYYLICHIMLSFNIIKSLDVWSYPIIWWYLIYDTIWYLISSYLWHYPIIRYYHLKSQWVIMIYEQPWLCDITWYYLIF